MTQWLAGLTRVGSDLRQERQTIYVVTKATRIKMILSPSPLSQLSQLEVSSHTFATRVVSCNWIMLFCSRKKKLKNDKAGWRD